MTEKEVADYIKKNAKTIEKALAPMRSRLSSEDIDDARQELNIVMLKCLRLYNPGKGAIDAYINKSIFKKAKGLLASYIAQNMNAPASLETVHLSEDGAEWLSDEVPDDDYLHELLDARLITEDLLKDLSPKLRGIVKMWAEKHTLHQIGDKYNISAEAVRQKIEKAIVAMCQQVEGGEGLFKKE